MNELFKCEDCQQEFRRKRPITEVLAESQALWGDTDETVELCTPCHDKLMTRWREYQAKEVIQ